MRLEQLIIFVRIAESHSIRQASKSLYLTPQNLSKSMLQLEDELHTTLYIRTNTGIELTKEGEEAYVLCRKILDDIDELKAHFNLETEKNSFSDIPVNIVTCPILDTYVSYMTNRLFQQFPNTIVNEHQISRTKINKQLTEKTPKNVDIFLTNMMESDLSRISPQIRKDYHCYFLYEDELMLQVPKGSPLEQYNKIPADVLETVPLLLFDLNCGNKSEFENILEKQGCKLKHVSRTANLDTCSKVALNSNKCCFVGYPSVELRPLPNVTYIPLFASIKTKQIMLVRKKCSNKKYIGTFVEMMDQYFDLKEIF